MSVGSTISAPSAASSSTARSAAASAGALYPQYSLPWYADPLAAQPPGHGVSGVVDAVVGQHASSAAASATVGAIGPAVSCDDEIGTIPAVGQQADRGLDPDAAVERGRAGDRAVRLGADRER